MIFGRARLFDGFVRQNTGKIRSTTERLYTTLKLPIQPRSRYPNILSFAYGIL